MLYVKPVPDVDILFTIVTVYLSVFFSLILVVYQFLVKNKVIYKKYFIVTRMLRVSHSHNDTVDSHTVEH